MRTCRSSFVPARIWKPTASGACGRAPATTSPSRWTQTNCSARSRHWADHDPMANREALRDLQARLASRMQAAKAEGLSISWLAVRAGGLDYLLPLAQSGEIFPLPGVQTV